MCHLRHSKGGVAEDVGGHQQRSDCRQIFIVTETNRKHDGGREGSKAVCFLFFFTYSINLHIKAYYYSFLFLNLSILTPEKHESVLSCSQDCLDLIEPENMEVFSPANQYTINY